jgi:ribosomal protein L11 methyltransferase
MNSVETSGKPAKGIVRKPYGDLFIYYLEGKSPSASAFFDSRFIGNWEEEGFSFLFFSKPADGAVSAFVESRKDLRLLDRYRMTYDEWQGGRVSSMEIGGFLIVPPWEDIREERSAKESKEIVLDPGVVFGNGLHATTRDCIEALETIYECAKCDTALDLGCGTGILALAAAALGCRACIAVDFNLLAVRTTRGNIGLNAMEDKILAVQGDAVDFVDAPSELIIANIHYDIMKRLLDADGFYRKRWFVLSGLLRSQANDAASQLERRGVKISKRWERDGVWHTFMGEIG